MAKQTTPVCATCIIRPTKVPKESTRHRIKVNIGIIELTIVKTKENFLLT